MINTPLPQQPNTLGKASLILSILSLALVFGISLCAVVGVAQRWALNPFVGTPLFICAASNAFLGFVGAILGFAGLFGVNRSRTTAIVGLILGLAGVCLFIVALMAIGAATGG
jgi:hypothetical protein